MLIKYRTVLKEAKTEQIIDRSRFIGYVKPVETRAAAEEFIQEIRTKHRTATHNVPAYVIGEKFEFQWASDDGEPQGTSGAPIVQMLVKEGITNVVLVITRYFGGIKLGTGGLVRAYTGTAKLALEEGGLCAVKEMDILKFKLDYTYYGKLQNLAENGEFQVRNTSYEDVVYAELAIEPERSPAIKDMILNFTVGTGLLVSETKELVKIKG